MNRSQLRHFMRHKRQTATLAAHVEQAIHDRLLTLPIFQQATRVALYFAHQGEVRTQLIWHSIARQHKPSYFPIIQANRSLQFAYHPIDAPLRHNRYGIAEPYPNQLIAPDQLDVVLLPLLAFDAHGNRLGMGAGYYDRTFAFKRSAPQAKPWLIGLAYAFQKVPRLAPQPWDVSLDWVVTEQRSYGNNTRSQQR